VGGATADPIRRPVPAGEARGRLLATAISALLVAVNASVARPASSPAPSFRDSVTRASIRQMLDRERYAEAACADSLESYRVRSPDCARVLALRFDSLPGSRAESEEVAALWNEGGARPAASNADAGGQPARRAGGDMARPDAGDPLRAPYGARLVRGRDTDESVRDARLEVLRDRRARGESTHPFIRGAFVTSGDWR